MKKVLVAVVALILLAVGGIAVKFYALSPVARPAPDVTRHVAGSHCAGRLPGQSHNGLYDVPFADRRYGSWRRVHCIENRRRARLRQRRISGDRSRAQSDSGQGNRNRQPDRREILRAMREGIAHDGHVMFPMMPYTSYANLSDEDALDIIAYVRTFKPIKNDPGPTKIDFPVSMFIRAVPKPVEKSPPPEPTEPVARGLWIMANASCAECHDTIDDKHQPIPGKHLAGGQHFTFSKGVVYAPNLTSTRRRASVPTRTKN